MLDPELGKYTESVMPLFEDVDMTEQFQQLQIEMAEELSTIAKWFEREQVVNSISNSDFAKDANLSSLVTQDTMEVTEIHQIEIWKQVRDVYNLRIRDFNSSIGIYQTKLQQMHDSGGRYASLGIDIRKEFEILNSLTPFTMLGGLPTWKMPTFTLSDRANRVKPIELPGLYLHFQFNTSDVREGVKIIPNRDEVVIETQNHVYYHPHVNSDGIICLGEGEDAVRRLWREKKIVPLTQLITNILSSYNPRSPFMQLGSWVQLKRYTCENCGNSVDETRVKFVNGDQNLPGCPDCVVTIDRTPKWKIDYVYSAFHDRWIPKQNATKALDKHTSWDYFENILSLPNFVSCPKCFTMVHKSQMRIHNGADMCTICVSKN